MSTLSEFLQLWPSGRFASCSAALPRSVEFFYKRDDSFLTQGAKVTLCLVLMRRKNIAHSHRAIRTRGLRLGLGCFCSKGQKGEQL